MLILIEATVEAAVEARIEATELPGSVSEVVPVGSVVEEGRLRGEPRSLVLSGQGEITLILSALSGEIKLYFEN